MATDDLEKRGLARKLYAAEKLKSCYLAGCNPMPEDQEGMEAYIAAKIAKWVDVQSYNIEKEIFVRQREAITETVQQMMNENSLVDIAARLVARRESWRFSEDKAAGEYYIQKQAAESWKHGRANPQLSAFHFEVNVCIADLINFVIAEETVRLLGPKVESSEEKAFRLSFHQQLAPLKIAASKDGKIKGRVDLFGLPELGSEQRKEMIAAVAGEKLLKGFRAEVAHKASSPSQSK